MSPPRDPDRHEIVIIRRRLEPDAGIAKSGIWKIAHADFMTALMAFFLVMWLISATPQQSRESIASYFNPIKLADATPDKKGVRDPQRSESKGERPRDETDERAVETPEAAAKGRRPRYDEAVLFRDPYAVLSEIAGREPGMPHRTETTLGERTQPGQKGGTAYRDPFDPIYWQVTPRAPTETEPPEGQTGRGPSAEDDAAMAGDGEGPARPETTPDATGPAAPSPIAPNVTAMAEPPREARSQPGLPSDRKGGGTQPRAGRPPGEAQPGGIAQTADGDEVQLQAAIEAVMKRDAGTLAPTVEVRKTDDGLLVSLTDNARFSMFASGSAEPQPELVMAIDRIAPLLSRRSGTVVIRGHTDNRPYRTASYDNWRLSTARAHMAYHMLIRGGLPEARIERVEGYADRQPRLPNDPAGAQNRRIEILLREKNT
ncbi:MAG: chemotaxis protein MotB [Hyphomicrobiales bacterium]|jgi:chemotaxis protein MotB